jgi:hypothetical protein
VSFLKATYYWINVVLLWAVNSSVTHGWSLVNDVFSHVLEVYVPKVDEVIFMCKSNDKLRTSVAFNFYAARVCTTSCAV